ncbi:MAG: DUF4364 family protein [Clostridiaceae bacterium]|nr:DUF4364 family protein [Clostridiaceae bacterium]
MHQVDDSQAALILLSIIEKQPNSTSENIIDSAINSLYLDYFSAATALDLLTKQHLIHLSENKSEAEYTVSGKPVNRLNITPEGSAVLKALGNTLPTQVQDFLEKLSTLEKKERTLTAHYSEDSEHTFKIKLEQKDHNQIIFSLELNVPTEKMARNICQNWQKNAVEIYQALFRLLLPQNDD